MLAKTAKTRWDGKGVRPPLPAHGGDIAWARDVFGEPQDGWLDLSTGLNPWPYPVGAPTTEDWARLPTRNMEESLMDAAGRFYGVPAGAGIVAASGAQALIQWLPRIVPPSSVAVLAPTYAEHATVWRRAGHDVTEAESLAATADVVVVVNPNNPDGRVFSVKTLLERAGKLASRGGLLIVDEAFADSEPALSLSGACGRPGLVVLKSFGKFFGLAGLRLGFAIGPRSVCRALADCLGPWAVATPALNAGIRALGDRAWAEETRRRLPRARQALDEVLTAAGLRLVGGTDLFRLVETDRAEDLFQRLGKEGVLVRGFQYNDRWLRFGLPGGDDNLARLRAALRQ